MISDRDMIEIMTPIRKTLFGAHVVVGVNFDAKIHHFPIKISILVICSIYGNISFSIFEMIMNSSLGAL